jgi:hypothetical protein
LQDAVLKGFFRLVNGWKRVGLGNLLVVTYGVICS